LVAEPERDWTKDEVPRVDPYDLLVAQVVVRAGFVRCPFCRVLLEYCLGRCTLLGPSRVECPRCGRMLRSHRKEWAEMSGGERGNFLWLSFAFTLLCTFLGFIIGLTTLDARNVRRVYEDSAWLILGFPVTIIAVQAIRLLNSYTRARFPGGVPQRPTWWSLDFNLRWKLLPLMIVLPQIVAAWLYIVPRL
jgi:hypothetical protein